MVIATAAKCQLTWCLRALYRSAGVVGGERAQPDVAEARGVAVILQAQRPGRRMRRVVVGQDAVAGGPERRLPVVDQQAVLDHRQVGGVEQAAAVEARRLEHDIVALPLAGPAAGVDQRRVLAVDGAGVAVGIGAVVVAVEHLDLVQPEQEHAAVAAPLAAALHPGRTGRTPGGAGSRRSARRVSMLPVPGTTSM